MTTYSKLDTPEVLSHIFHPVSTPRTELPPKCQEFECRMDDGTTIGCRYHIADKDAPTILYFHGNGENVSDYDTVASKYRDFGMNILITTYRGYGWSDGEPSVASMYSDAATILDALLDYIEQEKINNALFVMGRSLGSAPAIELAATYSKKFKGMLIESGFGDSVPLLETLGVDTTKADIEEEDGFRNCEKIAEVEMATLILHGAADSLIPPASAEKLQSFSGARGKRFLIIPGAEHNTTIAVGGDIYFQTIKDLLIEPVALLTGNIVAENTKSQYENNVINMKRTNYLSWDEYFMAVALLSAQRSKDPSTQVGACVANEQNKIVGVGYNGFPWGCSDDELPWSRDGAFLDTKYPYVCHAELNAVLNSITKDLRNCRIYVGLFPCNECTKVIIQAGICEIIYLSDKYKDSDAVKASKIMLEKLPNISYRQLKTNLDMINLSFLLPQG